MPELPSGDKLRRLEQRHDQLLEDISILAERLDQTLSRLTARTDPPPAGADPGDP